MADKSGDIRLLAVQVTASVVKDGASLGEQLPAAQESLAARDAALLQELVFGVTRWSGQLDCELGFLMKKPLRNKDADLKVLLWLAMYEIQFMRTPDYAVVSAYAGLTHSLRKKWAKSLVNGVLRQFLRDQAEIESKANQTEPGRTSLPQWISSRIKSDWPQHFDEIVDAGNKRAPLVLRVNQQKSSCDEYLQLLQSDIHKDDDAQDRLVAEGTQSQSETQVDIRQHGRQVQSRKAELGRNSLVIEGSVRVQSLPGFNDGLISVQDSAAQLAAELIEPRPGQRLLDACAAPGGKTCHLLESQPQCTVTSLDSSESRMKRVRENLDRLDLEANCVCADAADVDGWWDRQPYDAVLLDAPCSALGVLRRHPDIRLLRRDSDIESLVALQKRLLTGLWQTVKPGGRLVYATCSVLRCENELQVVDFLANHEDAAELALDVNWGQACKVGRQILPGQHEADGFYYAIIKKKSVEDAR